MWHYKLNRTIMNTNKSIIPAICGLLLSVGLSGCSDDFLEIYPESNYTGESFYTSDEAVSKACEPLYNRAWFNFNRRAIVGIGSYRANDAWNPYVSAEFARFQTTALTGEVVQAWSSLYLAVTMSNAIIKDVTEHCGPAVSQTVRNRALGEAYLTRATSYFYMVRTWGPSILIEDNDATVLSPQRPLNPEEDVFRFIIRDLRKAINLLPEESANGRVSKYAAEGMLAKVLLAHSGWNRGGKRDETELKECIALCEDVIDNSGASLMEDYHQLFRYQNNNNPESLYAMQWADPLVGGWCETNALVSDLSFSDVCDVNCWGNNLQPSIDMIEYFNQGVFGEERWTATYFTEDVHYDYIKSEHGGYTYDKKWLQVKKGVVGCKEDNDGHLAAQRSPLNTYILRLADVYLTHAEACLGNSETLTSGRGLASFNEVRRRAGLSELQSVDFWQIVRERRIEFCMEYCNWFDMVSWYRWRPQEMLEYFNTEQHRGYEIQEKGVERINLPDGSYKLNYWVLNYFKNGGQMWRLNPDGTDNPGFTLVEDKPHRVAVTESMIFMPYPEADVLQNPYLSLPPEPYNFGNDE